MAIDISRFSKINVDDWEKLDTLVDTKVADLINWGTAVSALVAVIFIIIAGYTYITSTGEPDKVETAGKMITGAVIGLIVIFIARLLVDVILNIVTSGTV